MLASSVYTEGMFSKKRLFPSFVFPSERKLVTRKFTPVVHYCSQVQFPILAQENYKLDLPAIALGVLESALSFIFALICSRSGSGYSSPSQKVLLKGPQVWSQDRSLSVSCR